ncbi:MAG: hypothetical protein COV36_06935 [Alphaproteobacteria bacterium CG11_big_fil_rev_8_21_14_0_20_44_7]|nr:MAG: hypothetical protein COV36_06935 [Alphaproteobacteria bacterium CG11_big_fil_rev_8_21_14_0_20_44_7]
MEAEKKAGNGAYLVAAFYHFAELPKYKKIQLNLKNFMIKRDVKGTVLLTPEGVNGTISGLTENVYEVLEYIRGLQGFSTMEHKEAFFDAHAFERTKVKCKSETIGLGAYANPIEKVGEYIEPKDWNSLLEKGIPVIDTRNDYEVHLGTFEGAINPNTKRFKELPSWTNDNLDPKRDKEVAMFCTGGIRCEKYSAYLLEQGFEKVYHLKGGVLKYLEEVPQNESKWKGDCYVFDERVAVKHDLSPSDEAAICPNCGNSVWTKHRAEKSFIPGERCPRCPEEN